MTLTLTLVCTLVLMLVTAPLFDGRVVKRPPIGQVRVPPTPVRQDIMVEVVKTVVVEEGGLGMVVVVATTGPIGVT